MRVVNSPEVIALRTAAAEWGEGLKAPVVGKDTPYMRLDSKLQRAAVKFAESIKRQECKL